MNLQNSMAVVLAGGRSSRMGKNKALLPYKEKTLLKHMVDILSSMGFGQVFVSGSYEGYASIPDEEEFAGPAQAIRNILQRFNSVEGVLFVPVDMPLLSRNILSLLTAEKQGAFFIGWPLPVWITKPYSESKASSVRELIHDLGIYPKALPDNTENLMLNANTPEEWLDLQARVLS